MYFFLISSNYWNTQSPYETNSSMENIMRLILEEVIMSDRYMLDGQFATFFQQ